MWPYVSGIDERDAQDRKQQCRMYEQYTCVRACIRRPALFHCNLPSSAVVHGAKQNRRFLARPIIPTVYASQIWIRVRSLLWRLFIPSAYHLCGHRVFILDGIPQTDQFKSGQGQCNRIRYSNRKYMYMLLLSFEFSISCSSARTETNPEL